MTEFNPTPLPAAAADPPTTKIRQEGDFYLEDIKLIAFNGEIYELRLIMKELNIYEDIFNNSMSGTIELRDGNDLPNLIPIIGEEKLILKFTRPDENDTPGGAGKLLPSFKMEFRVYKMTSRSREEERLQSYVLHFCSPETIVNHKVKVRKNFSEKLYSEMTGIIYDENIKITKPIKIEETTFEHDFAIRNMQPFKFFNQVATQSLSPGAGGASYVFYEDVEKFSFISLNTLMDEPPKREYLYQISNVLEARNIKSQQNRQIEKDIYAVENYGFSGSFDILKNLTGGMYASRLFTYDTVRHRFFEDENELDYPTAFDKTAHVSKEMLCTDAQDALGSPLSYHKLMATNQDHDKIPWIVEKEPGILPWQVEEFVLLRANIMQQIDNQKIQVSVSGDPRRKVGETVEFDLPRATGDADLPLEPDRYLSGKYLVVSLRHKITNNRYDIDMEIIKDSYLRKIIHVDPTKFYERTY